MPLPVWVHVARLQHDHIWMVCWIIQCQLILSAARADDYVVEAQGNKYLNERLPEKPEARRVGRDESRHVTTRSHSGRVSGSKQLVACLCSQRTAIGAHSQSGGHLDILLCHPRACTHILTRRRLEPPVSQA